MANTVVVTNSSARQLRLVALVLVPLLAILAVCYVLFLKPQMVVLARDLRPEEASAIVEALKKQDVTYELAADGKDIIVPSDRVDEIRLSLVANNVAAPGMVGFELFNQSDMGLTDFAQKVNYQRALQGELTRTIMAMDGIQTARVHLAIPERSLFRANRVKPTAAVALTPRPGQVIDPARVLGIQQLVAAAVPDLELDHVSVLNERGQLLSQMSTDGVGMDGANSTEVERTYAQRIGQAISLIAPDMTFELKVLTVPRVADGDAVAYSPDDRSRPYAIRVTLFTPAPLPLDRQIQLRREIARTIGTRPEAGDDIRFAQTPISTPQSVSAQAAPTAIEADVSVTPGYQIGNAWLYVSGVVLLVGLVGLLLVAGRRRLIVRRERIVTGLREQLRLEYGVKS